MTDAAPTDPAAPSDPTDPAPTDARAGGDPALFRLLNEIGIIAQLSGTALDRALPDGMNKAQFTMLNHFVRLGGPRSPAQLAASFQVTKGAVTHTMQRLEARGLLTVRDDPADGRAKLVDITPAGRAMRARCVEALDRAFAPIAGAFPDAALLEALPLLERLRRLLDEDRR